MSPLSPYSRFCTVMRQRNGESRGLQISVQGPGERSERQIYVIHIIGSEKSSSMRRGLSYIHSNGGEAMRKKTRIEDEFDDSSLPGLPELKREVEADSLRLGKGRLKEVLGHVSRQEGTESIEDLLGIAPTGEKSM